MTIARSNYHIEDLFTSRARLVPVPPVGPIQGSTPLLSLAFGLADPMLFPCADLLAATSELLSNDVAALNYGPPYAKLTEQVVARLRARGIPAEPNNVLISYGSAQVLALLPQLFVEPGDVVLIEGPSFLGAVDRFGSAGARLISIPTDAQGMDTAALEATLIELRQQGLRPRFIYTIPTFQNPTGTTMPLERRKKLLALSADYGVLIVEDDAYGDLRFEGEPLPPLAALDEAGWVIYVGTISKILAPGLRIGWAYADPAIISRLLMFKAEGGTGPFLTQMVARYCADGRLDHHITTLNACYRHKRDVMLATIARHFPASTSVLRPEGGFFVWCKLPPGMSATALLNRTTAHGVTFLPGTRCFADGQGDDAIRLAFSFQPVEQIVNGIELIGRAMAELGSA